ncbi:MAG TPA: nicotinate-nucleotide--dimethylbenzimidazole phosphoribosyltransferase [Caulobacteraceae bacterium]|jgi:nicotinate-nucleotide--dimethylbenzimidazole phosphoribosyltransferase|nr:nicotinate-nucleotide--dimethylbenzimidazole phosphoribosyltransferase [Caulobacteraceae bacterium]
MTSPFDDLKALLAALAGPDEEAASAAGAACAGRGRLSDTVVWLAAWQGRPRPQVLRPIVAVYAAAHTGAPEPEGAAKRRLDVLAAGEGAIGAAARVFGAGVEVFDLAVDRPVPDGAAAPAMSERECAATVAFGMEALAKTPDLLIVGETAAGAERAAGALALALFGGEGGDWAAGGDADWAGRAVARAKAAGAGAPLDWLRQLGGRETAAMAGAIIAARTQKVPVLLDGYAACAAGAVLQALAPGALDHCQAAQVTTARGHARLLERIGKTPLLDLGLGRSDGLGSLPAIGLLRTACALQAGA